MISYITRVTSLWPPFRFISNSTGGPVSDILQTIKSWYLADPSNALFAGSIWTEEIGKDAVYPCILISTVTEMEPGECLEDHSNQIQIDIYGSPAETVRALSRSFHNAFVPKSGRSAFVFTEGSESATLYEGGEFTKRARGPNGSQLWRSTRLYTIHVDNTVTNP